MGYARSVDVVVDLEKGMSAVVHHQCGDVRLRNTSTGNLRDGLKNSLSYTDLKSPIKFKYFF